MCICSVHIYDIYAIYTNFLKDESSNNRIFSVFWPFFTSVSGSFWRLQSYAWNPMLLS
jgi:hypothetical protein